MLNQKILTNLKANLTGFNLALYQKDNWQNYSFGNVDDRNIKTNLHKIYDIASLTKTFTATQILLARKNKLLKLNQSASDFLDFLKNFKEIKIKDLLRHQTNLNILKKYLKNKFYSKDEIENILFKAENLSNKPTSNQNLNYDYSTIFFNYNDLNYLFLGKILEKIYKLHLDQVFIKFSKEFDFKQEEIGYNPINFSSLNEIVKTEQKIEIATVQDEKANWLQGVAGHSGLFSSTLMLQKFIEMWLKNSFDFSPKIYQEAFFAKDFELQNLEKNSVGFGLVFRTGWLTKYPNHAGFSGPFFAFNPANKKAVVMTTNHHFPTRNLEKREFLLQFYRQIISNWIN